MLSVTTASTALHSTTVSSKLSWLAKQLPRILKILICKNFQCLIHTSILCINCHTYVTHMGIRTIKTNITTRAWPCYVSARWSELPEEDTTEAGSSSRAMGSMKLLRGPFLMTENYGETFSALHMASHLLKRPTLRCKVPASYTFHLYPAHFCPTTSKGSAPGLPHWELTTLRKIFQHYIFPHMLCVN